MARIRDLGINVIPGTMRPLEIGPGAAFEIQNAPATPYLLACDSPSCIFCPCNDTVRQDTSNACEAPTGCPHPSHNQERPGYHASGFTLESVAELKRQLQARRTELDH
jgi:hypothetical protein